MTRTPILLAAAALSLLLTVRLDGGEANAPAGEFDVRITQVDTSRFPRTRVFVSVTDREGRPLRDDRRVRLAVYEGEQLRSSQVLAEGWGMSTVLALDTSGSMAGVKLEAAKVAALSFLAQVPAGQEVALVVFDSTARLAVDLTNDRDSLTQAVQGLVADGQTALQDAVALALDRLQGRDGRRSIVLLTDGRENGSVRYPAALGLEPLLDRAAREEVSISAVGFDPEGSGDLDQEYLRRFERTRGRYLFAPDADELRRTFVRSAREIGTEYLVEFHSELRADGRRQQVRVELAVAEAEVADEAVAVRPGLIPHVRGDHAPYALAVGGLLALATCLPKMRSLVAIHRFRSRCLRRLSSASPWVGRPEVNSLRVLRPGDLVLLCPSCQRPHYPRSWRLNRCGCMVEHEGRGHLCYHRILPSWLRSALDSFSGSAAGELGRRWLCRCAGDKTGW